MSGAAWNILIVDDEEDVHSVSKIALRRKLWRGRPLKLHSAFSAAEARELLSRPDCPQFEVALVDVVMETEDAGLQLVRHMRQVCPAPLRIVLRTGQPGRAPEDVVLNEYDIDYYLSKPEVTADKLYAVIRACIRSSQDMSTLLAFSRQLRGFTQALQSVTTLSDLLLFMDEGLKFLELKYTARIHFSHDLDGGKDAWSTGRAAGADAAMGALRNLHQSSVSPLSLTSGIEVGLGERDFLMTFSVAGASQGDQEEEESETDTLGGIVVSLQLADSASSAIVDGLANDARFFLENWVSAYSALQLQEAVARDRMLREKMYLERVESIAKMVTGVAHEINTPLGIANTANSLVSSAVEELQSKLGDTDETVVDLVEATRLMSKNIQRAHDLIKSFKQLSAGQLSDQRRQTSLREVIEDSVETVLPGLRNGRMTVNIKSELGETPWDGYPGHLSQVIINFLQNASRYAYPGESEGGAIEIKITDEIGDTEGCYVIAVKDFGQGMTEEVRRKAFDAFFTTAPGNGGTGLGLSIVHNIVTNLLGGKIHCKSKLGEGTTFIIKVPKVVPAATDGDQA